MAVRLAKRAHETQNEKAFARIPEEVAERTGKPYTIVGYLSANDCGHVLDERGFVIDVIQPGDSFVTMPEETPPS